MARKSESQGDSGILGVINNPEERRKFKTTLATVTHHMQMIDDQKEAIKETVTDLSANTGIDKKLIRKLANTMYKHDYASRTEEEEHFQLLYETLINSKVTDTVTPEDE